MLGRLAASLVVLALARTAAGQTDALRAELDRWVPGLLRASGVPGLSLAVVHERELAFASGYGVKEKGVEEPIRAETVFEAVSLSKPVFAYGVLLLARAGELDLDAPLTSYVKEPIVDDPRLERITARLVLSHATGFPNWRPRHWTDSPEPLEIDFDPGSRFGYSGEGYEYLKLAVERVTGMAAEDYLKERVLRPLGMLDSSFVWQEAYTESAATGHDRAGEPASKWQPKGANVAGSLHTTANDYARFVLAMLDSDSDAEIVELMTTRQTPIDDALGWGLGWGLETTEAGDFFWHWGDNDVFQALVMGSRKDGSAVVVLTNSQNGLRACQAIVRAVLGDEHPALEFRMLQY